MGSSLRAGVGHRLLVNAVGTDEINAVELVTRDGVVRHMRGRERKFVFQGELPAFHRGILWLYVRVWQNGGGVAWSSPFFFE